jgi:hypothetical protein
MNEFLHNLLNLIKQFSIFEIYLYIYFEFIVTKFCKTNEILVSLAEFLH